MYADLGYLINVGLKHQEKDLSFFLEMTILFFLIFFYVETEQSNLP